MMSDDERRKIASQARRELAQAGGRARQATMTPAERSAHARRMLDARYQKLRGEKAQKNTGHKLPNSKSETSKIINPVNENNGSGK